MTMHAAPGMGRVGSPASPVAVQVEVLEGTHRSLSIYRPVLALTMVDQDRRRVVIGARTPHNVTHAHVVSVPTMRIPRAVAEPILDNGRLAVEPELLGLATEALAARKLGLGDALEANRVRLEVAQVGAWQGHSLIDHRDGRDVVESLTMFNVVVTVRGEADVLPPRTASYDPLRWVDVDVFLRVAAQKDLAPLGQDFERIEMCVRGLCVRTSVAMLGQR